MSKLKTDTLLRAIKLCSVMSYRDAATNLGVAESTFHSWRLSSKAAAAEGDASSPFYLDGQWWHEAIAAARSSDNCDDFGMPLPPIEHDRPDIVALRAQAAERQKAPRQFPHDQKGRVMAANTGAPRGTDDRSDHVREQQPVKPPQTVRDHPRAYEAPLNIAPSPRPSYAKPVRSLDTGERIGRGTPPPGGFRISGG